MKSKKVKTWMVSSLLKDQLNTNLSKIKKGKISRDKAELAALAIQKYLYKAKVLSKMEKEHKKSLDKLLDIFERNVIKLLKL